MTKQDTNNKSSNGFLKLQISKLFFPFVIAIFASVILSIISIFVIQQIATPDLQQKIQQQQLSNVADSAINILTARFNLTNKRLAALAESPEMKRHAQFSSAIELDELAALLKYSFADSLSFQILPWTPTATVGLKQQGITLRNNIETLMVTRAGGNRVPSPEVYLYEKQWLVSFAQPVVVNGDVVAVLLVSYSDSFFSSLINNEFYRKNAAITILSKSSKQNISSNQQTAYGETVEYALPFTGGVLQIASSQNSAEITNPTIIISIVTIALSATVLAFIILLLYRSTQKKLLHDAFALNHYSDALKGIHPTSVPKLYFGELNILSENIAHLASRSRSPVTPDMIEVTHSDGNTRFLPQEEELALPPEHIFRAYDIRGNADEELTDLNVYQIGQAIGSEANHLNISSIIIGRDGRLSSDRILASLNKGITSVGVNVIDIGVVPSPVVYFAAKHSQDKSGIMITASHNGAEDNGLKIVLADSTLQGKQIHALYQRIKEQDFIRGKSKGKISQQDFSTNYQGAIADDILIGKPFKIVIDAQNGVGGELAANLFRQLNCEVLELNCNIDGNFPKHAPDPSKPENLEELRAAVIEFNADLGIAFDGDADRMVAVSHTGHIATGDQILMLFAEDIAARNPATTIIYDVKCSYHLEKLISQHGGKPLMWKTGHANIKTKMQETSALLGGEYTGHYFFKERWHGFDDGIYSALRLIELLSSNDITLQEHLDKLPKTFSTPEFTIAMPNDKIKFETIRKLQHSMNKDYDNLNTLDGIRLDFNYGWGLIRASNTSSTLNARFEANSETALEKLKELFRNAIIDVDNTLTLPF